MLDLGLIYSVDRGDMISLSSLAKCSRVAILGGEVTIGLPPVGTLDCSQAFRTRAIPRCKSNKPATCGLLRSCDSIHAQRERSQRLNPATALILEAGMLGLGGCGRACQDTFKCITAESRSAEWALPKYLVGFHPRTVERGWYPKIALPKPGRGKAQG